MRNLTLTLVVLSLLLSEARAQLPPAPDTIWRWVGLAGVGGDTVEMQVYRQKGNPRIWDTYRRQNGWELARRDTLYLDNQGRIFRHARLGYFRDTTQTLDSFLFQVRYLYTGSGYTALFEGIDFQTGQAYPGVKMEIRSSLTSATDVMASFIWALFDERSPYPVLYKSGHYGDSLRYYEWDTTLSPPQWVLRFEMARRPGPTCDTLIELHSGWDGFFLFCADAQGYIQTAYDTTGGDSSAGYRFIYYDAARRVIKDSTERFDYDGTGQVSSNGRTITSYTYDTQGRLINTEEVSISRRGGLILRRLRARLEERGFLPTAASIAEGLRTQNIDTVYQRWFFSYGSATALHSPLRGECFTFSSQGRWGTFAPQCLPDGKKMMLELYDAVGRLYWRGEVSRTQPHFSLPQSLPVGVYILRSEMGSARLSLLP